VVTKRATFKLSLHPSAVSDADRGARALLDGMLMRHHDQLGGVLVAYSDASIASPESARIVHMAGYVDVRVRATARVFCPAPGAKLLGRVNKVGVDHVGLLVLDVFNASVSASEMPAALIHNPVIDPTSPGGCWESAADGGAGHRIAVGTEVVFQVRSVSEYDDVLHLIGSLAEEGTGSRAFVEGVGAAGEEEERERDREPENEKKEGGNTRRRGGEEDEKGGALPKKKEKKEKSAKKKKKEKKEKKEKSAKKKKKEKRRRSEGGGGGAEDADAEAGKKRKKAKTS
jgi:DNA-directed RNA polymerase I subunit RPA43